MQEGFFYDNIFFKSFPRRTLFKKGASGKLYYFTHTRPCGTDGDLCKYTITKLLVFVHFLPECPRKRK